MHRIHGRKTEIREITLEDCNNFLEEHHRQGAGAEQGRVNYGLFHEDELVGVASFCGPRTSGKQKKYTVELYRLAFKNGVRVQGGASKLIKHFIKKHDPIALFTYQSTVGETTNVYKYSGMTLVEEVKPKKILVRDGVTYETAENNRHDWFSIEQAVRYGPDALIGTQLGEVWEDGERVNNIELFLRSGYHLEEIPGDRVYEWLNPNVTHYLYKITSTVDDGYYIGRHSARGSLTKEECENDGYMGSGGVKFQDWVEEVGGVRKEILEIVSTREKLIEKEKKIIDTLYRDDPNCKNSSPGGLGNAGYGFISQRHCPIHGISSHVGKTCKKCVSTAAVSTKDCDIHGMTLHMGELCKKCLASQTNSQSYCPKHGVTWFNGLVCRKCSVEEVYEDSFCPIHGVVAHQRTKNGKRCLSCQVSQVLSKKLCEKHGHTTHQGDSCGKCTAEQVNNQAVCKTHGLTGHKGDSCNKCASEAALSEKFCETHGVTLHLGNSCCKCTANRGRGLKNCLIHGETFHHGDDCVTCHWEKVAQVKECPKHGLTNFKGSSCNKCAAEKVIALKTCKKHGETKHNGPHCLKCQQEKTVLLKTCEKHGETKFKGSRCCQCIADKRSAEVLQDKIDRLVKLGLDVEQLKEMNLSQTKLVAFINERAGESLISRPMLKKVLQLS